MNRGLDAKRAEISPSREPLGAHVGHGGFSRRGQGMQARHRRGVIDDPLERRRQADELPEPERLCPPLTEDRKPLAVLLNPPLTEA